MPGRLILALLLLSLAACRNTAADDSPVTLPTEAAPVVMPPATLETQPAVPPTATALVEGLIVRLATPDPSPNCPEHYPWFFDNPAAECATTLAYTWGVLQPFERGVMVWFQDGGRTYVLIEDGSPYKPYREAIDTEGLSPPGLDSSLVPPPGLYQPVLGFAKFWRGLVPGHEWVRESLGWATAPEAGYSALWQCNDASGDAARCYFTGPRDEIIVITRGPVRYWTYWQGAVR